VKQAQTTMDYADAQHSPFRIGQSVKHPTLGIGKIVDLPPSRAVVDFPVSGRKTLLLEYARCSRCRKKQFGHRYKSDARR